MVVPAGLATELHTALLEPDLLKRTAEVAGRLGPLGPEALGDVRAAYRGVNFDTGDVELVLLADWWARFDPKAAFDWAHQSKVGWHPSVLAAVIRVWAEQDPVAAGQAALSVQDERLLQAALVGVVRGWEASSQDGLEEFLSARPPGSAAGGRAIEASTRGKVARGTPEAAMAWAESLPGRDDDNPLSSFKLDVIGRVAEVLVETEPEKAADWVARVRGTAARVVLLIRVGMRWAKKDGAAAMRWLSALPSNRARPTAIQETYRSWYLRDPKAAGDWIKAATLEPWLDPAVATYALQRSADDIHESLEWANRVVDPNRREGTLEKIAMVW